MSMPIQRQSEAYAAFDDGLRFQREHRSRDLPDGLVNMLAGPRIQGGLLNTREAGFGAYPDSNNFAREDLSGHGFDDGGEGGPGFYGGDPHGLDQQMPPEDPYAGHDPSHTPEMPLDQFLEQHDSVAHHFPPDEPPMGHMGAIQDDYDAQFSPHSSFSAARHLVADGPAPEKTAAPISPQVVPGWVGHGFAPGHRVGLPWRDQVIPGTVTHLHGQEVGVRWDDNQHSTEEPKDLRPL